MGMKRRDFIKKISIGTVLLYSGFANFAEKTARKILFGKINKISYPGKYKRLKRNEVRKISKLSG